MIHNRQFIISKKPHLIDSTWLSNQMKNGLVISYQQNLRVEMSDDKSIALIGDAWQVDPDRENPQDIVKHMSSKTSFEELYTQEETWSGRYIIVTDQYVLLDATGNLGLFYSDDIMSSSVALLRELRGYDRTPIYPAASPILEGNFMAGPLTMYDGIYKLLPSQMLDIKSWKVKYRKLLNKIKDTDSNIMAEFERVYFYGINSMYQHFRDYEIWFSTSGGRDSRVALAAFEKMNKTYYPYVWRNKDAKWVNAGCYQDIGVARLLCKVTNKRLTMLEKDLSAFNKELASEFDEHTDGMVIMSCKWQYPCGTLRPLQERGTKILNVRNNIWEMCSDHYNKGDFCNTPEKVKSLWQGRGERFDKSIQEWLKVVNTDTCNTDMSFGERAEWELLHGCWLSNGMQGFDIFDNIETIHTINSRRYLSLLMSLGIEQRRTRAYQIMMTNQWMPKFAKIPYGDEYKDMHMFIAKVIRKLKKILSKV